MRMVANSIPKSGTHLLDRLLVLLGFRMVDLGGMRPYLAESSHRFPLVNQRLKSILGLRKPEDVMGIGPHLVEGGRFPPARRFLRGRGEKVTVGVVSPQRISRRWLTRRLSKVPDGGFVNAHCIYTPELADLFRQEGMKTVCILRDPRAEAQRLAVERVARYLGVEVDEATMGVVEEGLFGVGRTFRKGQIGGWREEFSEEHERAVREVLGSLLVEMGYER